MFVTSRYLVERYGIDKKIARCFVDRDSTKYNLYGHEKQLYLRSRVGFIFIQSIIDVLFETDINKNDLLSNTYLLIKSIGHNTALDETKQMNSNVSLMNLYKSQLLF